MTTATAPIERHAARSTEGDLLDVGELMRAAALDGDGSDGVLGGIAVHALAVPGKRLRARLALESCAALADHGARGVVDARPWAAAVEMVHNASLVHDDLQDGDRVRRGHPSTWAVYGAVQAINAGDLMLTLPYRLIGRCDVPAEVRWHLVEALARAVEQMTRGQAEEPSLRTRTSHAAWLACARMKTGALLAVPVEGGALLAGRAPSEAHNLARPFARAGELFQLVDDVIDAFGDKGRERRGCDLDEGKVSSLVVAHLARHPADSAWLMRVLDAPRGETDQRDIDEAIARFDRGGALDDVLAHVAALADEVRSAPMLAAEPGLGRIASALIERVLAPLEKSARTRLPWTERRVS